MWAAFKRWLCAPDIADLQLDRDLWKRWYLQADNELFEVTKTLEELRPLAQLGREYRQILELRKAQPREKGRFVRVKKDGADA